MCFGLSAGSYDILVQDTSTGETESYASNPVIITEPSLLTYSSSVTSNYNGADVSCFGATDGEITVNAIGGNPPILFHMIMVLLFLLTEALH